MPEAGFMAQYRRIKARYPDVLVLFQVGDFYEAFGEDAEYIARTLGVVLTSRSQGRGAPRLKMAGFSVGASQGYVERLVNLGQRVALCRQMGDDWNGRRTITEEGPCSTPSR